MSDAEEPHNAIKLLDATAPAKAARRPPPQANEPPEPSDKDLESTPSDNWLVKKGRERGSTIRKEWTKHKYARFQEGRAEEGGDSEAHSSAHTEADSSKQKAPQDGDGEAARTAHPARTHRSDRLRERLRLRHGRRRGRGRRDDAYEVDVLYENQRGAFLCGIPLYSSRSLLNFDPAAWQTAELADSPVNITNAQVPDPTWAWAWPSWYVDMSRDVDDEGWEYSFSFRQGFSWHGSQPWHTSFVRRRRWLRKRVRVRAPSGRAGAAAAATMHDAHVLNQDYFTIHATSRGSRDSSADRSTVRASTAGGVWDDSDGTSDDDGTDITSIALLLRRLRQTTVDRKKLDAFRDFLRHGGDELAILPDHMEDIMSLFLYQNSRRQVLLEMEDALSAAAAGDSAAAGWVGGSAADSEKQAGLSSRRKPGLSIQSALNTIASQVRELEFYSDIKAVSSPLSADHPEFDTASIRSTARSEERGASSDPDEKFFSPMRESGDSEFRIKGIPQEAHIGENVGLAARIERARKQQDDNQQSQDNTRTADGAREGGGEELD